ncbi:MAG: hypothetical protein DRN88_02485 [Candidatus Hydrothermarchaeota archaeon]|nr:MAG: hypothetical protein DRN88_02485 [Candidatus Hydrothermarchaeota archaeon]
MAVISVKVSDEIKRKMKEIEINWSEEIRNYILKKIKEKEKEKILKEIKEMLKEIKVEEGTASSIVREDRDSH